MREGGWPLSLRERTGAALAFTEVVYCRRLGGTLHEEIRSTGMNSKPELFDEPTEVSATEGEVVLDGPDGVNVKLTPEAARETSNRLWDGAAKAMSQRAAKKPSGTR